MYYDKILEKFDINGSFCLYHAKQFLKREVSEVEKTIPLIVVEIADNKEEVREKLKMFYGACHPISVCKNNDVSVGTIENFIDADVVCVTVSKCIERDRYGFSDLIEIIRRLRDIDGCPWDRVQTHETIRLNALEESYELIEAIDLNSASLIKEESGDVLLQALFHSVIAESDGEFTVSDMISTLTSKLITRHTHIFGMNTAKNADEALAFWDKAKSKEKGVETAVDKINRLPKTLPALMRAEKTLRIISKAGFEFENIENALKKLYSEINELMSASESNRASEGGDVLFAAVHLLMMMNIESELAINETTKKFSNRFGYVEKQALESGRKVSQCKPDELMAWYLEYKENENR
ncbi:MAG: nucleoside triphosphate pyrophosphohydrolase [Christensenellaceae bacterium]|jgi:tetrapyrrole methylase family protein/MazG family protein|nr:nucleoside triphosphate pyrophosphohydrolase [Christensenellaceae bacterium]